MTPSCAQLPHDHKGRSMVRPALTDIGALRLFTDGVELKIFNYLAGLKVLRRAGRTHLKPRGLDECGCVTGDIYRHSTSPTP